MRQKFEHTDLNKPKIQKLEYQYKGLSYYIKNALIEEEIRKTAEQTADT